jgi:hypothetical protein
MSRQTIRVKPKFLLPFVAIMLLLAIGLAVSVSAQGQTCRDVNNITVCGDLLMAEEDGQFHLRGNIKIGPKGAAAVVHVTDMPSQFNGAPLGENTYTANYFHLNAPDANTGATDFLIGEAKFIADPTGLHLLATKVIDDPSTNDPNTVVAGRLFVDPVNRRIFLPAAGAVPIFNQKGIARNAAYRLAFMSQAGALAFYKEGGSVNELSLVDGEFDLNTKVFKATLPVDLKLNDAAENPNLRLTMRFQWTETRQFTGAIDGFKYAFAGLLMDVAGVVVNLPQGATPATFEAATVRVLKSDNPAVPNLDPTDANLIFAFSKLKYKSGAWEIGGVEVGVKDWEFGTAFRMINQTLGIIVEPGGVQALQIKSTMQFGAGSDASKLPIVLKIGRAQVNGQFKPVFAAGLQSISPKLGTFKFNLTGASFVGDAAQNFYGIQATSAALQWPPHLGGQTAAAINGFKLGVNKDKKLQFQIGSGTIGLPPFENNLFRGVLAATTGVVSETLTITGTGVFNVKLPGNANTAGVATTAIMRYNKEVSASATARVVDGPYALPCRNPLGIVITCPTNAPPPPPPAPPAFELRLSGFNFKLAGFGVTVTNPRGQPDGGFAADNVAISLPIGMVSSMSSGSGIAVQGFAIAGNGAVAIQGGGFELAPITVGSVQFAGLKGAFVRKPNGSYEFQAAGKLPLPGIEPGTNSGGIGVNLVVRLANTGNFGGVGVVVDFGSPPLPPIPIGSTGMNLTKVTGAFDLTNQTVTIGLTLTAASKFQLPLGSLGSIPLAKANGGVTAQFNPFKLTGNADLSILIFEMASASIKMGAGEGFDGRDGMNAQVNVNAVIVQGLFKMRVGKGTASNPEKRRFAANATWIFGIPANTYGVGRPPFNLGGIQVGLAGGAFTDKNFNPAREAVGVKGSVCGPNGNVCVGFFVNLGKNRGSSDFLDFTGIDKYVIIPAAQVRAAAARGEPGFQSRLLTLEEATQLGLALDDRQRAGADQILQDVIDVNVATTTTLLAGINYPSGYPTVRLRLPGGAILTEQNVNNTTQTFIHDTAALSGTNLFFVVNDAAPGTYQLLIDNAPATYENVSYTLNEQPTAAIVSTVCGGANVSGVTVTCANARADAPADAAAADASSVTVNWTAADSDSPDATVAVGYVVDPGEGNPVDYAAIAFRAEDLPLGAGAQAISFSEVGTGKYRIVVAVDDQQNGIVLAVSDTVIDVVDLRPPAVPVNLTAVSQAGELLIKWDQNSENDLAGYEIGFGLVNDPAQFIYSRNMGPKEIVTGTNNIVDAKLWGLADDTTVFYGLRSYDGSGNYSAWTPLQSAKPWALAPNTWNPVPNGAGGGSVAIAFAAPMDGNTLTNALTVRDASGNVLTGDFYLLTDAETASIVGVEFRPSGVYNGVMNATLLGGQQGARALDGRTMGANFTWTFTYSTPQVFLPTVQR